MPGSPKPYLFIPSLSLSFHLDIKPHQNKSYITYSHSFTYNEYIYICTTYICRYLNSGFPTYFWFYFEMLQIWHLVSPKSSRLRSFKYAPKIKFRQSKELQGAKTYSKSLCTVPEVFLERRSRPEQVGFTAQQHVTAGKRNSLASSGKWRPLVARRALSVTREK